MILYDACFDFVFNTSLTCLSFLTGAMHGNEIWERFLLVFVYAKNRPQIPVVRSVSWDKVQVWTLIQIACAISIFAVAEFASVGYLYPAMLTLLVPFRSYILHQLFPEEDLRHLDPVTESEEEFSEEQRLIHQAFRDGDQSTDENDLALTTRAEFRGQGMKRALMNTNRKKTIVKGKSNNVLNVEAVTAGIEMNVDDSEHPGNPYRS